MIPVYYRGIIVLFSNDIPSTCLIYYYFNHGITSCQESSFARRIYDVVNAVCIHRVTEDILCFAVCPPLCRWTKSQLPFETQHPPGTGGYTFLRSIQYVRRYAVDATGRPDFIGPSTGYRRIYFSSLCPTSHELFAHSHTFRT